LRDLDREQTVRLLCQINADLRLGERDRGPAAKLQQEICAGFLDDETIDRFKKRFGPVHLADRPHRRQNRKESSRNGNLGSCSFAAFSLAIKQTASGSKSIRCDCRLEEFGVDRDLHFIAYQSWITFDAEIFPVNARAAGCSIYALPRGSLTGPCEPSSSSTMVFLTP
jgi:hypothetical protein